jgi:hypothetical protein
MVPVTEVERRTLRPTTFTEWCSLVCRFSVVKRGLKFCLVVGIILIAINHGDVILRGELQATNYIKMGFTVIVPYMVSVFSSVGAIIEQGGYQPKVRDEGRDEGVDEGQDQGVAQSS